VWGRYVGVSPRRAGLIRMNGRTWGGMAREGVRVCTTNGQWLVGEGWGTGVVGRGGARHVVPESRGNGEAGKIHV